MVVSLDEKLIGEAERYLSGVDAVMENLVVQHGPCLLMNRRCSSFDILVEIIISQQLSARAASTIKQRLIEIVGTPFCPHQLLLAAENQLRSAGLSGAKLRYIKEIAIRIVDGRLSLDGFEEQENEMVISKLIEIPGIGRWSAEMFLIFALKRPDVVALHDAGLQRAARLLYNQAAHVGSVLEEVSNQWKPFRSVGSWYLWRHLDN